MPAPPDARRRLYPSSRADAEHLSPNAAARELGVTGEAVKQWIYRRRLPATKLPNGYWRIARSDLDRFLRERERGDKRRILVVGDPAGQIASAIKAAGWRVLAAQNPVDAVVRALDRRPSAAVIDIASQGADGWVVAEKLRVSRGTKRLPILLVAPEGTGSDPEAMDRAIAVSAQVYLCGEVSAEALVSAVDGLFAK